MDWPMDGFMNDAVDEDMGASMSESMAGSTIDHVQHMVDQGFGH